MKLLLDELYDKNIRAALRERGWDVVGVTERPDLRAMPDELLIEAATAERRAIVTENARHFVRWMRERTARGEHHFGLVLTSSRSMHRTGGAVGLFVRALEGLLEQNREEDALLNAIVCLQPQHETTER